MIKVVFEIDGRYNEWLEIKLNHIPTKGDDVYLEDEVMLPDGENFEVFNVCYIIGSNGIDRVDIKLKKKN